MGSSAQKNDRMLEFFCLLCLIWWLWGTSLWVYLELSLNWEFWPCCTETSYIEIKVLSGAVFGHLLLDLVVWKLWGDMWRWFWGDFCLFQEGFHPGVRQFCDWIVSRQIRASLWVRLMVTQEAKEVCTTHSYRLWKRLLMGYFWIRPSKFCVPPLSAVPWGKEEWLRVGLFKVWETHGRPKFWAMEPTPSELLWDFPSWGQGKILGQTYTWSSGIGEHTHHIPWSFNGTSLSWEI